MKRKSKNCFKILLFIFLVLLLTIFFLQKSSPESTIKHKTLEFMQASLEGNINVLERTLSKNAFDLGGGFDGDGKINFEMRKEEVVKYLASEQFKNRTKNLMLEDTLDLAKIRIYNYDEILANNELQVETFGFKLLPGDYLIIIPPKENSYFHEGVFAYYRKEGNDWKIIATN